MFQKSFHPIRGPVCVMMASVRYLVQNIR